MHRTTLLSLLLLAALLATSGCAGRATLDDEAQPLVLATVVHTDGTAEIMRKGSSAWSRAAVGDRLFSGDALEVRWGSVRLSMRGGSEHSVPAGARREFELK